VAVEAVGRHTCRSLGHVSVRDTRRRRASVVDVHVVVCLVGGVHSTQAAQEEVAARQQTKEVVVFFLPSPLQMILVLYALWSDLRSAAAAPVGTDLVVGGYTTFSVAGVCLACIFCVVQRVVSNERVR
jgi:hypothetical protein